MKFKLSLTESSDLKSSEDLGAFVNRKIVRNVLEVHLKAVNSEAMENDIDGWWMALRCVVANLVAKSWDYVNEPSLYPKLPTYFLTKEAQILDSLTKDLDVPAKRQDEDNLTDQAPVILRALSAPQFELNL